MKNKTALVLGADTPAGRAVSLQLSREGARTIIAGFNKNKLDLLFELVKAKKGDPFQTVLTPKADHNLAAIDHARDMVGGHIHFIINTLAAESSIDNPLEYANQSREVAGIIPQAITGRGAVRLMTLWPEDGGDPPAMGDQLWHCLVRVGHVETSLDEMDEDETVEMVRAAGCADAMVFLLSCPPSACPVDVRLSPRELKA